MEFRRITNLPPYVFTTINNLKIEAIPLLAKETMAVLREKRIDSSSVALPSGGTLKSALRRAVTGRRAATAYIASKRGRLSARNVEMVIDGCGARGFGKSRVRHATASYAVIEPA